MENLVIGFAVVLMLFLVCRDVLCWYWKINEIAASLKQQASTQRDLLKGLDAINENLISIRELLTPDAESPPEL